LWRHAGRGRGVTLRAVAVFAAGWTALCAALLSPLDALGQQLFSAHMLQHEVLMLVAAPLLVLGQPFAASVWAFPSALRQRVGAVAAFKALRTLRQWLALPLVAWSVHALVLWVWHAPPLFEAALLHRSVHTLQHATFFFAAALFWWACWAAVRARHGGGPLILYQFTTMVHTGALGALLVFSPVAWFPAYLHSAREWSLTPLEDQQLGGLIMWIPGGIAYLIAGLALLHRWALAPSPARA
jgi:cytochrome c oxidase assembly factor CtaG